MTVTAPYGSWDSPISVSMLTEAGVSLAGVSSDGGDVYWLEGRPLEGGRQALVRRDTHGVISDATPETINSRSRVHEYGGGSYAVRDGLVVSCHFDDQRVYRINGEDPVPITPEPKLPRGDRYADFAFHGDRLICVRERHRDDREPSNTLVTLPLDGSDKPQVIIKGHDFYSSPRVSPDGTRLAWVAWDHPNMPWDGCELWCAALAPDGSISEPELVAGGSDESIFQPEWSPGGVLHFVSDRTGWWNLFRLADGHAEALHLMEAEFGFPQWVFGSRRYAFLPDDRIVSTYSDGGFHRLGVISGETLQPVHTPYDHFGWSLGVCGNQLYTTAGSAWMPMTVVGIDVDTEAVEIIRSSLDVDMDPVRVSHPEPIEFATTDDGVAHAFYYPPRNPEFAAPEGDRPPLLVLSHGGPTGATFASLELGVQFWTSRGFAVVDVNYRGSAGYGRGYRDSLRGNWGVHDLDDCINAALFLADAGHVDGDRIAIRGGSAGGYTTLCALAFSDVFAAGASYFGVGDLAALATDTHKFESRYLDSLIGPYPEAADVYEERSPQQNVDGFATPVILLQGLDDRVVPPSQAEEIAAALDAKGIPYAYLAFAGEGHGFRKAENIERAREAELYFYSRVFGFDPADELQPVDIAHEDAL
ncbi:MAG: prolyl oligopeptidase family serine peptidase [Acidimicrobiia bacterium]|nr:prolyl oligopeptidase family serine peptidase [Acidimicrobiia bacterium]